MRKAERKPERDFYYVNYRKLFYNPMFLIYCTPNTLQYPISVH
jgi:hypothetical protein